MFIYIEIINIILSFGQEYRPKKSLKILRLLTDNLKCIHRIASTSKRYATFKLSGYPRIKQALRGLRPRSNGHSNERLLIGS
jgi:hypothetical protein